MKQIISFLKGKKSYTTAVVIALITLLQSFNLLTLTPDQLVAVLGFLGAIGLITLRAGMNK